MRGQIEILGTTAGRLRTTIDATGLGDRVLHALSFYGGGAALRNVVITGGSLPSTTTNDTRVDGGGIQSAGKFEISDSYVHHNEAARGGGIAAEHGSLRIEDTVVSDNRASALNTSLVADGGGGIFAINVQMTVRDSTIENNTSAFTGGGITVAPIYFPSTPIKVERSLVAGNHADGDGGGIYMTGNNGGYFRLDNSTVSRNTSDGIGGGMSIREFGTLGDSKPPAVVFESTIAGNTAQHFSGAGVYSDYGGYDSFNPSLENTIVANNAPSNCSSDFDGYRVLSSDWSCNFPNTHSMHSVSARLGPLADNGGPTRTHALLAGSPAIDAGDHPVWGAITDQRGQWRTSGAHARFGTPHDLGAYESNPTVP